MKIASRLQDPLMLSVCEFPRKSGQLKQFRGKRTKVMYLEKVDLSHFRELLVDEAELRHVAFERAQRFPRSRASSLLHFLFFKIDFVDHRHNVQLDLRRKHREGGCGRLAGRINLCGGMSRSGHRSGSKLGGRYDSVSTGHEATFKLATPSVARRPN